MAATASTHSEKSERPMEAPRGDAVAEKGSAGLTIAPEQLRKKGKSYRKMFLKSKLTKFQGKMVKQSCTLQRITNTLHC